MKHKLGMTIFEEFYEEYGREPSKEEFMQYPQQIDNTGKRPKCQ